MCTTKNNSQFLDEALKYWSGSYRLDSRGPMQNDPSSYSNIDQAKFDPLYNCILKYNPKSVLEIGCNACNHLDALQKRDPSLQLAGMDLNPEAINYARKCFNTEKWELFTGNILEQRAWEQIKKSYDVVFTHSIFMLVPPCQKKQFAIDHIIKKAKLAVVLNESHSFDEPILDVRKDKSHSPYTIDNYSNYGDFQIEKLVPMNDYPACYRVLAIMEMQTNKTGSDYIS